MRTFLQLPKLGVVVAAAACALPAAGGAVIACTSVVGCSFFAPPESKVRAGELYEAAHPKYDPYFRAVHDAQVQWATWDEQKRVARRPLLDALKIDPEAADVTLIQATHERVLGVAREAGTVRLDITEGRGRVVAQNAAKVDDAGRNFFSAIESCVFNEHERAKAMKDIPAKADELIKQGRALEPQVRDDLSRRGGRAPKQVLEELQAAYEVLGEISKGARLSVREAEDFIADLRRAVGADMAEAAARPSANASSKTGSKPARPTKATSGDAPKSPPTPQAAETPKPKSSAASETPKPKVDKPAEAPAKPTETAPAPKPKPAEPEFNP